MVGWFQIGPAIEDVGTLGWDVPAHQVLDRSYFLAMSGLLPTELLKNPSAMHCGGRPNVIVLSDGENAWHWSKESL